MNPRIYKKQAKRAVELLRALGGWGMNGFSEPDSCTRHDHPLGIQIDGCPVFWQSCYTDCGTEWDTHCPRDWWMEAHYWTFVVPEDHFQTGGEDCPPMSLKQRRERFSTGMLAPGWRWRGGKAIKITDSASGRAQRTNNNEGDDER